MWPQLLHPPIPQRPPRQLHPLNGILSLTVKCCLQWKRMPHHLAGQAAQPNINARSTRAAESAGYRAQRQLRRPSGSDGTCEGHQRSRQCGSAPRRMGPCRIGTAHPDDEQVTKRQCRGWPPMRGSRTTHTPTTPQTPPAGEDPTGPGGGGGGVLEPPPPPPPRCLHPSAVAIDLGAGYASRRSAQRRP